MKVRIIKCSGVKAKEHDINKMIDDYLKSQTIKTNPYAYEWSGESTTSMYSYGTTTTTDTRYLESDDKK